MAQRRSAAELHSTDPKQLFPDTHTLSPGFKRPHLLLSPVPALCLSRPAAGERGPSSGSIPSLLLASSSCCPSPPPLSSPLTIDESAVAEGLPLLTAASLLPLPWRPFARGDDADADADAAGEKAEGAVAAAEGEKEGAKDVEEDEEGNVSGSTPPSQPAGNSSARRASINQ